MGGGGISRTIDENKNKIIPALAGGPTALYTAIGVEKAKELATPEDLPQAVNADGTPNLSNADTQAKLDAAAEEERKKGKSRAATILTGGEGLLGKATTAKRTLLGS